jgi:hypothetical protein
MPKEGIGKLKESFEWWPEQERISFAATAKQEK